jgi:hypothetical protein
MVKEASALGRADPKAAISEHLASDSAAAPQPKPTAARGPDAEAASFRAWTKRGVASLPVPSASTSHHLAVSSDQTAAAAGQIDFGYEPARHFSECFSSGALRNVCTKVAHAQANEIIASAYRDEEFPANSNDR